MERKIGRIFGIIAGSLVVILVLGGIGAWMLFGEIVTAANSVEKIQDGLYKMEYTGDYGFEDFLAQGGAESDGDVADYLVSFLSRGFYTAEANVQTKNFGCSTLCEKDEEGKVFFGRNYDWAECTAMIVYTKPKNGYASVSTCCLDFLGFDEGYTPDGSMMERIQSLAAIYVPLDGMNEKGLMVADLLSGDEETTNQQTNKTDLTTTTAIRLLLDKAANVEQAIGLLKEYDMHSSIGAAHHFSIADASGKSVVVEYVNGEMLVADAKAVTNHYLTFSEKIGIGSVQSHVRYATLLAYTGKVDGAVMRDRMASVAQMNYPQAEGDFEKTMWTIVYCPSEGYADFYFDEKYEKGYRLYLDEDNALVPFSKANEAN